VFDQLNGMPVHVLLVHAAVVFVPLLAVAAVTYALIPRLRNKIGWAAALLAVGAPAAAFVAKLSGQAFKQRLLDGGMKGEGLAKVTAHQGYGDRTFWFTLALGILTGLMIYFATRGERTSLPRFAQVGLSLLVVALAAVAGYYVFKTGDSGAASVWGA
jgi:uncharacterized membrane protein